MEIDRRVFELYDEYCHGRIDRREFLARAGALTVAGVSALAMAQALLPRYNEAAAKLAWERTIAFFKKNLA
jgi:carboxymethylenebutenolidase